MSTFAPCIIIKQQIKMNRYIILLISLAGFLSIQGQEIKQFSLQEAIDYAMENNYTVISAEMDVESAKYQVKESTSIGLPQIDASVKYNDNIARPVMILPPEMVQPGMSNEIQFGTKYDASFGASVNQLIFSGEYIVGLQAARKYLDKTNTDFFRNKVEVKQMVSDAYFAALGAQRALVVIDSTLKVTRNLADETQEIYNVGFAEDIDVDQLNLLVSDLEANNIYFENQLMISHAYLKFYLGLGENDSITLTDNMESMIESRHNSGLISDPFNVYENLDYLSVAKQKDLSYLQVRLEKASYMPTLSANLYYQTQAQREEWNFFDSGGKWYSSSALGITMAIPVFSSGMRRSKVKMAQIAYDQTGVLQQQLETQLRIQYNSAKTEYMNAYRVYENKQLNRRTAEKIFNVTTQKYLQGMASSLDILNTHTQFLNAESDYINSAKGVLTASEELQKILAKEE